MFTFCPTYNSVKLPRDYSQKSWVNIEAAPAVVKVTYSVISSLWIKLNKYFNKEIHMNNQVAALNWNETKNHESRAVPMATHVVHILFESR